MSLPQLYVEVVYPCLWTAGTAETMNVKQVFELSGKYNHLVHQLIKAINENEMEYVLPLIYPDEGYTLLIEYGIHDMIKLMAAIIESPCVKAKHPDETDEEAQICNNAKNIKACLENITSKQKHSYPYINLVIVN